MSKQTKTQDLPTLMNSLDDVSESVCELFSVACNMDLEDGKLDLTKYDQPFMLSQIPMERGDWTIFMAIGTSAAEMVSHNFTGTSVPLACETMVDIIGELNNILAGIVKTRLASKGFGFQITLPEVQYFDNAETFHENMVIFECHECLTGPIWCGFINAKH